MTLDHCLSAMRDPGLVAVIRDSSPSRALETARAAIAGGVRAIEITFTTPDAASLIAMLRGELAPSSPIAIGAGTVIARRDARLAIEAGAAFIVSPIAMAPDLIVECEASGVLPVPGAFTPTELMAAEAAGARLIKLFPAGGLGPAFLRDVRAIRPQLSVMPTGGIAIDRVGEWIHAGAAAIGVGTALRGEDRNDSLQRATRWCDAIRRARTTL